MHRGGSYIQDGKKRPVRQAGTEDHPEGNRPRATDGRPLDQDVPRTPAKGGPAKAKK